MIRKAIVAGTLMMGLMGSASAAWAGPAPAVDSTKGSASTEVSSAADPSSGDTIYHLCGGGLAGWVEVDNTGHIIGGHYAPTSALYCQGGLHFTL